MPSTEELRAALAAAELEEELVAAKAAGDDTTDLKVRVREARRVYREMRDGRPVEAGEARPAAVKTAASVKKPGGK